MPETTTQLSPEQAFKQYMVCNDIMGLVRQLTIACAQCEFDEGINTCNEMLLQMRELRAAFEPEEYGDESLGE